MWKIIFHESVEKEMAQFLDQHKERAWEVERALAALQDYPEVRWLRLFGDQGSARFVSDQAQRIRFAGKAFGAQRTLVLTHFSAHV